MGITSVSAEQRLRLATVGLGKVAFFSSKAWLLTPPG